MRPFPPFVLTLFIVRGTDQQTYLPVEMQFYISVMFLGLPDDINEETPSFLQFKKNALWTDQQTDRPKLQLIMNSNIQKKHNSELNTISIAALLSQSIHLLYFSLLFTKQD